MSDTTEHDAIKHALERIEQKLCDVDIALRGSEDGDRSRPGLILRVDRLERAEANRKLIVRTLIGSVVALIVDRGMSLIHK